MRGGAFFKKDLQKPEKHAIIPKVYKVWLEKSGVPLFFGVYERGSILAKQSLAARIRALIEEPIKTLGYALWDVEFKKEGGDDTLFVLIDRAEGISLDDCEKVTRLIDPILDEADPIAESYFLEVSSAGLERSLKTPEQFLLSIGKQVAVRHYKAKDGVKELTGTLTAFEDGAILVGEVKLEKGEYAAVKTLDTTL